MKFSIKDFFIERDQIFSFLWILSYLLKKSLLKNFIFVGKYLNHHLTKITTDLQSYITENIQAEI